MAVGALLFLAGCSGNDEPGPAAAGETSASAAPPVSVTVAPADGAADVSPVEPLEIAVTDGELAEVTVVDGAGTSVPGTVAESEDQSGTEVWAPETQLAYGSSY